MKEYMEMQAREIRRYVIKNRLSGKNKETLMFEWISLYAADFRKKYDSPEARR